VLVLFTPGNIEGFFEYGALMEGRIPGLEMLGPSPL
jgi:hypothetical protein